MNGCHHLHVKHFDDAFTNFSNSEFSFKFIIFSTFHYEHKLSECYTSFDRVSSKQILKSLLTSDRSNCMQCQCFTYCWSEYFELLDVY